MKIDATTSQEQLEQLYSVTTQREMLCSTPLNLPQFLRYAILFLLFPGMVLGYWLGLGITLVFCLTLTVMLATGPQELAVGAIVGWFSCGAAVVLWVTVLTVRAAWRTRRQRRTARKAGTAECVRPSREGHETLRWRRCGEIPLWEAELEVRVAAGGIAAVMVELQGCGKGRLLTPEKVGVCCVHTEVQEDALRSLLLYRLQAGSHKLKLLYSSRKSLPKKSVAHLLCLPSTEHPGETKSPHRR